MLKDVEWSSEIWRICLGNYYDKSEWHLGAPITHESIITTRDEIRILVDVTLAIVRTSLFSAVLDRVESEGSAFPRRCDAEGTCVEMAAEEPTRSGNIASVTELIRDTNIEFKKKRNIYISSDLTFYIDERKDE